MSFAGFAAAISWESRFEFSVGHPLVIKSDQRSCTDLAEVAEDAWYMHLIVDASECD